MTNDNASVAASETQLRAAVSRMRRRWRVRRVIEGLPSIVATGLVALFVGLALRGLLTPDSQVDALTRAAGYLLIAAAIIWCVLRPAFRRVTDRQVALYVEEQAPELSQLLLSAVDMPPVADGGTSPQLHQRIVNRAWQHVDQLHRDPRFERSKLLRAWARLGIVAAAGVVLIGLGPASLRRVAHVLFVPWSRAAAEPRPLLTVTPGDVKVPRGGALDVRAAWWNLADHGADIAVRSDSSDQWTRIPMRRDSTINGYVVRLFDVEHNSVYYVDVGGVRSPQYRITVTDQPTVKQLSVELNYPAYTGLAPSRTEQGGDVVAVTGTRATIGVESTLPIRGGALRFDDGTTVPMRLDQNGSLSGEFHIVHDGFYRVDLTAADGTLVPGSVQHSVEALVDHPPTIRVEQPGRDTRVTSIEEVPIAIRAADDYGVRGVALHYTVNGGADHTIVVADSSRHGSLDVRAVHTLFLEDMALHVGDLVAYHATARDGAGHVASSDIYFMEVRPFDVNYHAADDNGGGSGSGGGNDPGQFTQRQRDIVAGTFNWVRDSSTTADRDRRMNATTLALAQGKLSGDVAAQAQRMVARQVAQDDSEFTLVQAQLDSAVQAMHPAEDGLGRRAMGDAVPAEEHALQHLQAADDAFRDITVRRGSGGGGGGGGAAANNARDLADLFELQTDKLKNQYETPRTEASTPAQQAVDSVAAKLKQLADRQQSENQREQRLDQQMQQRLGQQEAQGQPGGQQRAGDGQPGGAQQSGGSQQQGAGQQPTGQAPSTGSATLQRLTPPTGGGPTGSAQRQLAQQVEEQARQLEKLSREQNSPDLADAATRAQQAADAMRQAAAGSSAEGAAALDRLRDAAANIESARTSTERQAIQDLAGRASALGAEQHDIAHGVAALAGVAPAARGDATAALDRRKQALRDSVNQLAAAADHAADRLRGSDPATAAAAANAASQLRNRQVAQQIDASRRVMQGGLSAEYSRNLESLIGETLDSVARQLSVAAGQVGTGPRQREAAALARTRDLVSDMESLQQRTSAADSGAATDASAQGASTAQQPAQSGGQQGPSQRQGQGQARGQSGAGQGPGQSQGRGGTRNGTAGSNQTPAGGTGVAVSGGPDPRQFRHEVQARQAAADSLRRQLAAAGVDVAPLDRAIQQMQQLQRATNPGNIKQLQADVVTGLKNFDFAVWRQFNAAALSRPALGSEVQVPTEYRAMVEAYYRALARNEPK
jgi:molybdenum-dependent DNA-binding transcriptional regulator ModE